MNISRARLEIALGAVALLEKELRVLLTGDDFCDTVQTSEDARQRQLSIDFEEYDKLYGLQMKFVPPPEDPAKREQKLPKKVDDGS